MTQSKDDGAPDASLRLFGANWSTSSESILDEAEESRLASSSDSIGSLQLLHGLYRAHNSDGDLARVLHYGGISVDEFESHLESLGAMPPRPVEGDVRLLRAAGTNVEDLFDRQSTLVLRRAVKLASDYKADNGLVRARDILGGIIFNPDTAAYQSLQQLLGTKVDLGRLRAEFETLLTGDPSSTRDFSDWLDRVGSKTPQGNPDQAVGLMGDKLDFTRYAEAMAGLVENTPAPFVVGVYGQWGTGKSSLMTMIRERLDPDFRESRRRLSEPHEHLLRGLFRRRYYLFWIIWNVLKVLGNPFRALRNLIRWANRTLRMAGLRGNRSPHIGTIWFNAWEHIDSRVLWGRLIEQIYESMEKQLPFHKRYLTYPLAYITQRRRSQIGTLIRGRVTGLIAIGAAFFSIPWLVIGLTGVDASGATTAAGIGLPAILTPLVSLLIKPATGMVKEFIRQDTFGKEGGLTPEIKKDLDFFYQGITGHSLQELVNQSTDFANYPDNVPQYRLVVFIDDLDRCPPDRSVEMLEAIKLLLDQPFVIVFLAVDTRMLVRAVEERYAGKLPETVHPGGPGMEYLEKIVQIPFWMPQASMRDYVTNLVSGAEARPQGATPTTDTGAADFRANNSLFTTAESRIIYSSMMARLYFIPRLLNRCAGWFRRIVGAPEPGPANSDATLDERAVTPTSEGETAANGFTRMMPSADEAKMISEYSGYFAASPRGVKRVVNLFRVAKSLYGSTVVEHRDRQGQAQNILKLIVLGERWPDFWLHCYRQVVLRDDPDKQHFSDFVEDFINRDTRNHW